MTSSIMMTDATYKDTSASEVNDSGREFGHQIVVQSSLSVNDSDTSCVSCGSAMDKRLKIFCSVCKNPLGHPLNNLIGPCSLTSCSKVYFRSIWMEKLENVDASTSSIPVLISHISSVDQRLCERNNEVVPGGPGQGLWFKEDGCVFNTIFCTFCSSSDTCLGIQVMATDALNAWLQNKILFCSDILEIKDLTASKDQDLSSSSTSRTSNLSSSSTSCTSKRVVLSFIEKFTYLPQTLQMQLPKRGLLSTSKG